MPHRDKMPPLNALRAFEAVSRLGSIAAASERLNVSASSISQHIAGLETFLGMKLFERRSNRLVLTEKGAFYSENIRPAFEIISRATHELSEVLEDGPLRISVIPSLAHSWLLKRLPRFENANPSVQLKIDVTSEVVDFDEEDVDLTIRYGAGRYDGANSQLLLRDYLAPVCTKEFAKNLENIFDLPKVRRAHASGSNPLVVTKWYDWGIHHLDPAEAKSLDDGNGPIFDDALALLESLKLGNSVGLVRYSVAREAIKAGELVAPLKSWVQTKGSYYLLSSKRRSQKPDAKRFQSWIKNQIADDNLKPE